MRILVLAEYESLTGGERSFLEAARRITAPDLQLMVAAPRRGRLAEALGRYNIPHVPFDAFNRYGTRRDRSVLRQEIADCISATRADVLHANSVSMSRLAGPVATSMDVPSIGHLRDIMRLSKASIADLNCHDRLLTVSHATRRWYVHAGLERPKTAVAYNGVDGGRFWQRPANGWLHRELQIGPHHTLVGSIGQIGMRKGVDLYVQAATEIACRRADVHFIHAGQRHSRKAEAVTFEKDVLRAAGDGPLQDRFHFLGPREDIEFILNELDLYVHPARQEPLGRVLLEAGASGVPVVATDVGGTREIFPPADRAALLVPPQSATALVDGIMSLLDNPAARSRIGVNARRCVTERFDAAAAANELVSWYRRVGARPR